ncbi:MAG: PIN domain-containing protein [Bacteroidaceae bacterium]|nr:PIN domain-containing protein [Bacteroidaceae bacterium]
MTGYILDTDTWIEYFHHRSGVEKHIADTPAEQIYASEVTIAELTYGALHSKAVEKHLQEPKEIEETFTVLSLGDWIHDYAEIRHALTSKGLIVGDFDILIAVTARQHGLTVVTHNTKHFSQMPGIQCVDWVGISLL